MAGGDDYVDKAFAAAEKKAGQMTGHHIDPNSAKMRSTNEKIVSFDLVCSVVFGVEADGFHAQTDKLRGMFEKATGKKVPSKISN